MEATLLRLADSAALFAEDAPAPDDSPVQEDGADEFVIYLSPVGKVFVHGEYWDAVSSASVPEGSRVRVTAVDGLTLRVEPLK